MHKVLIAEDDPISQKFIALVVERMGHCPFVSPNGRHAWETLCSENHFDMLITDVMMPGMDGATLIRNLRQKENLSTLPVLVMSAYVGVKEISELLDIGATWFITKPVEVSALQEYVARALG